MFSKKNKSLLIFLQLAALIMISPAPSMAAQNGSTGLSFVINDYGTGGLAITVPTNGAFSTIIEPETTTTVSLTLGTVTVTDTRRGTISAPLAWTTNAIATDLLSGADTLTASTFGYNSGGNVKTGGSAFVTEHTQTSLNLLAMVEAAATVIGNHVVTWTPLLTVPVPALQNSGTYIGTITHSVS